MSLINRRTFLQTAGLAPLAASAATTSTSYDVIIAGAGLGGCAAALAATRLGHRVLLTEPTPWIGGQLTSQGVPPDEHAHIETHGAPASYRELRTRIRDHYRKKYPLTDAARANPHLNPGNGSVSRLCHEPRAALAALDSLLAPAITTGQLTVLLNTSPTAAYPDAMCEFLAKRIFEEFRKRASSPVGGGQPSEKARRPANDHNPTDKKEFDLHLDLKGDYEGATAAEVKTATIELDKKGIDLPIKEGIE
ncbi:MAG: FAD-dependent oxidoreductase, partial [Verrucomicrobiales bacterium]|nr:FAD-dependent oxidoreductase [Verrucomicrobiales bacterium]